MNQSWKLSPSDLTFLWDECPRCFYLKVVHGFSRPFSPFPKIFNQIDKLIKGYYQGKPTNEISPTLPEGAVQFGERWVTSDLISFPKHSASCYIKGKFDTVVEFSDGSFGVVDFKTSQARPEHVEFYSRQLHAYAYALENPAPGSLRLAPITKLGLLCVEPVEMDRTSQGQIAYIGNASWLECPKDQDHFFGFLDQVLAVLEQPTPPESGAECLYCKYRQSARMSDFDI
jgi:hypothetical protein